MYPPLFEICSANSRVTEVFGTSPCRIYPFNEAPQGADAPYATWQVIGGSPENCLDRVPDVDQFAVSVDVYASTGEAARNGAEEIRDAIESDCHIGTWLGEGRDEKTRLYVVSFLADWIVDRFVISV